jgi:hypothetical protein
MANPGILIALCAAFLAVDGSAQTVPAAGTVPATPCRFTLERGVAPAADDDGETWLLTCHRSTEAAAVQPVVLRRIVRPVSPEAVNVSPAL